MKKEVKSPASEQEKSYAKEVGQRIKKWRLHLGHKNQASFAELLGLHISVLKKYETGRNVPGGDTLKAFADTGVNINWLLTGQGKMAQTGDTHKELPDDLARFHARFERLMEAVLLIDEDRRDSVITDMMHRVQDAARLSELERLIRQKEL